MPISTSREMAGRPLSWIQIWSPYPLFSGHFGSARARQLVWQSAVAAVTRQQSLLEKKKRQVFPQFRAGQTGDASARWQMSHGVGRLQRGHSTCGSHDPAGWIGRVWASKLLRASFETSGGEGPQQAVVP